MAKYYNQQGLTKKQKRLKRFRFLSVVALFAVFALVGMLAYDAYKQWNKADTPTSSTTPVTSTIASGTEIHATPYFQLQAPEKWRAITSETRDGHYVYRQLSGNLVEQALVIEVNNQVPEVLATTQITRVLPVLIEQGESLNVHNSALEHCKKFIKPDTIKVPQMIKVDQVTFPCNPESPSYIVVVGLSGGSNLMNLTRPSGKKAVYRITYYNLRAVPNSGDLLSIIETFETR